jgi:hypothetical protein
MLYKKLVLLLITELLAASHFEIYGCYYRTLVWLCDCGILYHVLLL